MGIFDGFLNHLAMQPLTCLQSGIAWPLIFWTTSHAKHAPAIAFITTLQNKFS